MDISAYQHMNIRMSTRGKRPLRNLTPSDKVRAIQRIHNGETKASVSRDIGVPESTLRGWCKNEQKLRFMCRQLGADQMSLAGLDNPPEKRLKFDGSSAALKFSSSAGGALEDFGYNRLPLSAMDIAANNAILEKIAFNEFMKKNALATEATKHLNGGAAQLAGFGQTSLPADYTQLAMMQNFNLLSLLNPSLAAMPVHAMHTPSAKLEGARPKVPLRAANSAAVDSKAPTSNGLSTSTGSTSGSSSSNASSTTSNGSRSSPTLSVKNWAKDPSEASSPLPVPLPMSMSMSASASASSPLQASNKRDLNDTNNNVELKSKTPLTGGSFPEAGMFPALFPGGAMPPIPAQSEDSETSNAALMDWCKVFNASLNFLALAAAAAALQQPGAVNGASAGAGDDSGAAKSEADNILFKHLTKNGVSQARDLASPGTHILGSDLSNDSYFDSEPEDLSVRSTNSKISSPANSRSQSPTLMSSSSANSDAE